MNTGRALLRHGCKARCSVHAVGSAFAGLVPAGLCLYSATVRWPLVPETVAGRLFAGLAASAGALVLFGMLRSLFRRKGEGKRGETGRRRAEQDARLRDETSARSAAEDAVRARDEALAFVAHDLRSPLQEIALAVSLLTNDLTEPRDRDKLALIRRRVHTMNRLLDDLLNIARMDGNALAVRRQSFELTPFVHAAVEALAPAAEAKHIAVELHVDPNVQRIWADPDRLLQVIENVVGNAVKFTPAGGQIAVRVVAGEGAIRFSVADTGPGMSADQLVRAFDTYWRGPAVDTPGAGLGLAIVKRIVEAHGGQVRLESEPGAGTTVCVSLPMAQSQPNAASAA
jgi:signal transduction histidine kinase